MDENSNKTSRAFWTKPNTFTQRENNMLFHRNPTFTLTRHNIYLFLIGWGKRILVTCGPVMLFFIVVIGINYLLPLPKANSNLYEYLIPVFILLIVIVSISYIIKVRDEGLPQTPPSKRTQPENTGKPLSREEILSRSRADNISINSEGYAEFSEEKEERIRETRFSNTWSLYGCLLVLAFLNIEKWLITGEYDSSLFIIITSWCAFTEFAKCYYHKTTKHLAAGILYLVIAAETTVTYISQLISSIQG